MTPVDSRVESDFYRKKNLSEINPDFCPQDLVASDRPEIINIGGAFLGQ